MKELESSIDEMQMVFDFTAFYSLSESVRRQPSTVLTTVKE